MKKKAILAAALIALMAAATYAQTESDFRVATANNAVTIRGYTGSVTAVVIPARIQNNPVTAIGSGAFQYNMDITSVTIPASVTTIGDGAFSAPNLISVTFQSTIPSSGFNERAFAMMGDLRDKYFATGGGVGTYTRPNGNSETWTKQGNTVAPAATSESAFAVRVANNRVTITGFTGPDQGAVIIPPTIQGLPVTAIAASAFASKRITAITIPNSVTEIGMAAFNNSNFLTSVTFQGTIPTNGFISSAFGNLGDIRAKFYASNAANGTPGTYTRSSSSNVWTRQ